MKQITRPKYDKHVNIRMDGPLFELVQRVVRLRRTTQSTFVREAIVSHLSKMGESVPDAVESGD